MAENIWEKERHDLALLDEDFLVALQMQQDREIYARIASLDINGNPIESIEGKVTDGSINVDGTSAVRRTCNLTMYAEKVDIQDFYWGLKTKFKLEIGLKNKLTNEFQAVKKNGLYPEIVWFPQGIFLITSFNTSISTKGYSISVTGKDKMCMLNGELGGQLFASIDFGEEEVREAILKEVTGSISSSDFLITHTHYYDPEEFLDGGNYIPPELEIVDQLEEDDDNSDIAQSNKYLTSALSGSSDYIFIPSQEGKYMRIDDKYWPLSAFDYYNNGQNNYIKVVTVTGIGGSLFQPIAGINYIYTPNFPDGVVAADNLDTDSLSFPLRWNSDGTAVFISRQVQELNSDTVRQMPIEHSIKYNQGYPGTRYKLYKAATKPADLFIYDDSVTAQNYIPNKYYYVVTTDNFNGAQDENDSAHTYFALNTSKNFKPGNTYSLRTFYTWDYEYTKKKVPIEKIIREAIHAYAQEPYHNIVINDLDDYGLEQLTYKGNKELYALKRVESDVFENLIFADQLSQSVLDQIHSTNFIFDELNPQFQDDNKSRITIERKYNGETVSVKEYYIAKIKYGDDLGYRVTDLTYTGELITNIGDTLTSVLDKLRDMLGEFEYFYDIEGHFVFQKKPTFVNTAWSQLKDNGDELYAEYSNALHNRLSFNFEGNKLITAVQNSPNLTNVRNDYVVWGKRKTLNGGEVPIHARYAIDKKPKEYLSLTGTLYFTSEARLNPSPQNADRIGNAINTTSSIGASHNQDLTLIPASLKKQDGSSDWWELMNWAEYYHDLTDAYPQQYLMDYGTEGFVGTITIKPNDYYNITGQGQLIIDFDTTTNPMEPLYRAQVAGEDGLPKVNAQGSYITTPWAPFQHRFNGCWHKYSEYLNLYKIYPNMKTFIYKPRMPDSSIIEKDGGKLRVPILDTREVDWRELIYRMALDYFNAGGCSEKEPVYDNEGRLVLNTPDHFLSAVGERNPYYYPSGYTGYEQYYTDMQGFWRQLYNPDYVAEIKYKAGTYHKIKLRRQDNFFWDIQRIWEPETISEFICQYYIGNTNPKVKLQYTTYIEPLQREVDLLEAEIAQLNEHPSENEQQLIEKRAIFNKKNDLLKSFIEFYIDLDSETNLERRERLYWNKNVIEHPEQLNFWIEFLDDENELAQYAIPLIGDRQKVVNEDKVKAIAYKEVPDIVVVDPSNSEELADIRNKIQSESGYTFVYIPKGFNQYLNLSYRGLSAKNKIDDLIYQFGYCIENVSITALPVYHLQPNTRIYVKDEETGINGEYIITKFTLPLRYSGTMNITAVKAPERLY